MNMRTPLPSRKPGRAWIRRIRLINWHGHENATLEVMGDMLAIIGDNGSGKSLILDAIDWALFPSPNKQFNAAAREGGRTSKRTLSNTILFFDPHGIDRADKGWRRQRTVGYCAVEIEHEGEGRWVYGSAASATPQSASPFYYALPAPLDQISFLDVTPRGQVPLQFTEFRAVNDALTNAGGSIFNASQGEEYNRLVARRLLNIEGADWQRRYDALYDVLHRMLGLKVDDALVSDPSGVVRQFLPIVDRPHLERLVEGLEGIQRIHRDIDEYQKLRDTLHSVVTARKKYHEAVLQHAGLVWLRSSWSDEDAARELEQADMALREAESIARQREAGEEAAYAEEQAARRELETIQQLHQGEVVQAVARANETLEAAQHRQERAGRELRQADERVRRAEESVASARHTLENERQSAADRLTELAERARKALGVLPEPLSSTWANLITDPGNQEQADVLHTDWLRADEELGRLAAHVQRIEEASAATRAAKQAERDARAQHEATVRALQSGRQALWARWDKMIQRWPAGLGSAPSSEPTTMALPPLMETCHKELESAHERVREAAAASARVEVHIDELQQALKRLEVEISQTQTEPLPPLSQDRERALAQLTEIDRNVAPVYRHLDLSRDGASWADAIEGLLEHLDVLTLLTISAPIEQARQVAGKEVDWHVLMPGSGHARTNRGSLASVLVTTQPEVRRYIDGTFGSVALTTEPPRSGDYLCPDGRYRIGDISGTVRLGKRSNSLIGVVRRQAAAAARRDELARERADVMRNLEDAHESLRIEREHLHGAELRARGLSELIHMIDEVEQRRTELRALRDADEAASVTLAAAGREAESAAAEEEDERMRWADATRGYPALADPAQLERSRQALANSVADAVARAGETRNRLLRLEERLRAAEDDAAAEREVYGMARAQMDQVDVEVQEAQRSLNQARSAMTAAGLENVETHIHLLQERLKAAEEAARQAGVAKGVALHQVEAGLRERDLKAQQLQQVRARLEDRSKAYGALLLAVADSLSLPANQVDDPIRYVRQMMKGRDSRQRLDDDIPRAYSAAEREQENFLVVIAEYQALVGQDTRFGLRSPGKRELALAPQGWLLNVAPRMEGTSDVQLLLNFLEVSIEQLQQTLAQRVTRVVRDIILGEVVSHLVEQLNRAQGIIDGLNERLANARFFVRNTRFQLKLAVRLARLADVPFDHVTVATALLEHGRAMPAGVQAQLTAIFSSWLDEQMKGDVQPSVESLVEQLDYRRWVDISLLHSDDLDSRIRPWDSAVSGFGSGGEQRVPVYVLLLTAAAMQFAVSNAPLRLLMHDEAFARMDQRNADLVIRFAQQLGVGLVIASPNLDLFAEGVGYATAYRLRQMPNGLIAREALHLRAAPASDQSAAGGEDAALQPALRQMEAR